MGLLGRKIKKGKDNKEKGLTESVSEPDDYVMEQVTIQASSKSRPKSSSHSSQSNYQSNVHAPNAHLVSNNATRPTSMYEYAVNAYSNTLPPSNTILPEETPNPKQAPLTATALITKTCTERSRNRKNSDSSRVTKKTSTSKSKKGEYVPPNTNTPQQQQSGTMTMPHPVTDDIPPVVNRQMHNNNTPPAVENLSSFDSQLDRSAATTNTVWSVAAQIAPHLTHPHPDPKYIAFTKKYARDPNGDSSGGSNSTTGDNTARLGVRGQRNTDNELITNSSSLETDASPTGGAGNGFGIHGRATSAAKGGGQNNEDISPSSTFSYPIYPGSPSVSKRLYRNNQNHNNSKGSTQQHYTNNNPEPEMPDSTYTEHYGDAYINKAMNYIYPNGYGSMRPRSFPWQISVFICISFTWLTVFIVGHCAQVADWDDTIYYQYYGDAIDDDELVIETRWCGSRALYFMWVLSALITALSCGYCSIIGYIKARDFAVANGRSQPPGMVGKSDYYVRIDEDGNNHTLEEGYFRKHGHCKEHQKHYQAPAADPMDSTSTAKKTIYQADGTPRFLGGKIYRPTQAAIHLTSR